MEIKLDYLIQEMDRFGNVRIYYRKKPGRRIRIREKPGTPEFLVAYRAAQAGRPFAPATAKPAAGAKPAEGSLSALIDRYYLSPEFRSLGPTTQKERKLTYARLCRATDDPAKPIYGDRPYAMLEARHVRRIRDANADRPEAANLLLKAMRILFTWAIEAEEPGIKLNPARDIANLKNYSEGHHSWTIEEVEQYEAKHPLGTKARLALAILLYTGQRRSDVVTFGEPMVRDGWLEFTQAKNRLRKPVHLAIPIVPALRHVISATKPVGARTWLVARTGEPYTVGGFGVSFKEWCNDAGLPHCSAHGLRKAAAARLAELGCSDREIMSITGHRTAAEVDRYTRGARQRILARSAMDRVAAHELVGPHRDAENGSSAIVPLDILGRSIA